MNRKKKQVLALLLTVIMLIGTGVPVFATAGQAGSSIEIYKPTPKTVASEAQSRAVSTFAEFKSAVEAGTPVKLTADLTATGHIATISKCIDKDIVIYGNGHTLNMGAYQFYLTGSHTISISDLTIKTTSSNSIQRYGVFCISGGAPTTSNYVWDTQFHNLTFQGSALLGTYNTDDYVTTKRMFNSAIFTGNTNITITSAFNAHNAVVSARNISISDTFVMKDEIQGTNTGATNPTYQHYFKSAGTGGVDSEADNTTAYGSFYVADGANVTITRSPGRGTDGQTSAYYRSLIYGYADHSFGVGAKFYAKAGTNLTSSSDLKYRSAVIRSNNASTFLVGKNADVKLETDLYNTTPAAASNGSYGYTALSLKKSGALTILVDQGATLDIKADGRNTTPAYGTRGQAPVVIHGSGSSSTTVLGNLNVYSENGNGWYYNYETSKAGKAAFTVESTGRVKIQANNLGKKGSDEYAAFEAYGKYDVDITVRDGGKMSVLSNGYRGMSLAGAVGYNNKNILVTGPGSELEISGVHWAIAAETQPVLSISAVNGGKIDLRTTGDIGDPYDKAGSAPSTVYSVGPTTYKVDGAGSEMNIYHSGGTYSAIFHDGYGPLKIHVTNGGVMDVYSKNSGTDTSARRAAITAQSTGTTGGSHASYNNEILVTGAGSTLNVTNENPVTHGTTTSGLGGDTSLYPTGAISFNYTAKGNIRVADGGNFKAVSHSLAPTIHLSGGKITFDNAGEFEIRNNSLSSSQGNNNTYATVGQAVYNEHLRKASSYQTAIEVINASVSVWSLLENDVNFADQYRDNHWDDVSFTAKNGTITTMPKNGIGGDTKLPLNQFDLSAYGRINGNSGHTPAVKSDMPEIDDVYEGDPQVAGDGIAGATVAVTFPGGASVNATVGSNNRWTVTSPVSLIAGQVISASQTEPGKLPSDEASTIVKAKPVVQKSAPPEINDVYEGAPQVAGSGIAGATVAVTFSGGASVKATVGSNNQWTVTSPVNLIAGQVISAIQTESGKLPSDEVSTIVKANPVMQKSAPPEINGVYEGDPQVAGNGIAGATVAVTFPGGASVNATVDSNNQWTVTSPVSLIAGQVISAIQTEPGKLPSDEVSTIVKANPNVPKSAPPEFDDVREGDMQVYGDGVIGAVVTVTFPDGTGVEAIVNNQGWWVVNSPVYLEEGHVLYAYQQEAGKLVSDEVSTVVLNNPYMEQSIRPAIDATYQGSTRVSGTGVSLATVTVVFPNDTTKTAIVDDDGRWTVEAPAQLVRGQIISAYQLEYGKLRSDSVIVTVQ